MNTQDNVKSRLAFAIELIGELRFEMSRDLTIVPIRGDDGNLVDVVRYDQVLCVLKHKEAVLRGVFKPRTSETTEVTKP